ncbi:isopenicillin n epimerase : Isopenicillin N epimerase OS=Amycolatopsis lactamdurans GN=cefD PE=3 SV=1: Aminotran_5 [Gemmataceae bacterium]|nr:isopenicillin n epimerase : Isopenicillin N epimerase OS=Amycolatopsis lactamdurans GN=cefD PE=3 SV=1: Aminotran_5 [Gemmataceae bacterium]VTU00221.1 isopenicillin n epimerase : Isopenicillin N epimerase OS=Amycolatopsis lactamdurans GN=cefD PE=3 SV=1: Aminotran_5 [Gemmataceae bacterium]
MPDEQPDWAAAREQMLLDPTVTMLNTGSFGPLPRPVFDRVTAIRLKLAAGPTDFYVRQAPPLLWEARERTAAFLGTTPQRFVFTTNVSAAINLVASGLRLNAPGEILMSDHEYGCMVWCWERAGQRQGLGVRQFKLPTMATDPGEIVAAARKAITPRTRVLFFSHVLSPTGLILPAKELCALARTHGIISVVDGAHAPAMLPLDVSDVGADFYTGNLHKWLLAPSGAGFVVIGPGNEDRLQPLHVSWGYHADKYPIGEVARSTGPDARDVYGSTPRTRFLEFEGTRDFCPWLAVPAAIDFQAALGWAAVRARIADLAAYTRKVIGDTGLSLATPAARGMSGAMTAFNLPAGVSAPKLRKALWDRRIEVPVIERSDRLMVRVSHHFYTTEAEIDVLAKELPACLREAGGAA